MKVLHENGFPVPKPIDQSRHAIVMSMIDSYPLRQIEEHPNPGQLYSTLMDLIVRFARAGLIHGDFNEFNILITRETGEAIVIDFPQMVSTSHENAEMYFNRDVDCIRTFFQRRFKYESAVYPRFQSTIDESTGEASFKLDVMVAASGFKNKHQKVLEDYMLGAADREREGETGETAEEEGEAVEETEVKDDAVKKVDDQSDLAKEPETTAAVDQTEELEELSDDSEFYDTSDEDEEDIAKMQELSLDPSAPHVGSPPDHHANRLRDVIAAQVSKSRAQEKAKQHSRKNSAGRAKGSKAKQDVRYRMDTSGVWA